MTHAQRPPELDHAELLMRQCQQQLLAAESTMPVMAVNWFGPASDLWRTSNDRLRVRIAYAVDEARIAADSIRAIEL